MSILPSDRVPHIENTAAGKNLHTLDGVYHPAELPVSADHEPGAGSKLSHDLRAVTLPRKRCCPSVEGKADDYGVRATVAPANLRCFEHGKAQKTFGKLGVMMHRFPPA